MAGVVKSAAIKPKVRHLAIFPKEGVIPAVFGLASPHYLSKVINSSGMCVVSPECSKVRHYTVFPKKRVNFACFGAARPHYLSNIVDVNGICIVSPECSKVHHYTVFPKKRAPSIRHIGRSHDLPLIIDGSCKSTFFSNLWKYP